MEQTQNFPRRATPDEIRRQPEYQYLTSWAASRKPNSKRVLSRPHTACTGSPEFGIRARAFSGDGSNKSPLTRLGDISFEKGILRLRPSTGVSRRERQLRRYSLGSLPADAEESVYKNIAHLFQTDAFSDKAIQLCSSGCDGDTSKGQQSHSKKKVIRFVDAYNEAIPHRGDLKEPLRNSSVREQKSVAIKLDNDTLCYSNERSGSPPTDKNSLTLNDTSQKTESETTFQPKYESAPPSNHLCANDLTLSCNEKAESNYEDHGNKDKNVFKDATTSDTKNITTESFFSDICDEFKELTIQPEHDNSDAQTVKTLNSSYSTFQNRKSNGRRRKHRNAKHVERSNSNYDADLEKSDKYLRAQSRSFTQTSQYMSTTKRGLSHLSMHYSQTNTAYNDRVIMSDLLKNGHTRNALIGDSVYAVERRLYSRRRDPMKSTTFYDRFASQTRSKSAQPARKRKSRTVADRAKERQERINKKKEELERGFPPRAWSLVEVGAEEIENMLNTCRYLRVDARKQPNVYGIVDLSDKT